MSKKITHEEFLKVWESYAWLTGKLADWAGYDWSDLDEQYNFIENEVKLKKYVDQLKEELENKTKLLELYKRLLEEGAFIPNLKGHRTLSEIKELENEKNDSTLKSGNVIEITRETHGVDVERAYHYSILHGKGITTDAITIPYENIDYVEMVENNNKKEIENDK